MDDFFSRHKEGTTIFSLNNELFCAEKESLIAPMNHIVKNHREKETNSLIKKNISNTWDV